ncbi:CG4455 [Drosophila busckii]|uniref:CG4455 n=1 Tax=Drosophila busckii TaxID=30019 RepID=A0A0M4EAN9_DROBS|nr:CG4455 [Drosophila busckii]
MLRRCSAYDFCLLVLASSCLFSTVDCYRGYYGRTTSTTTPPPPPQTPREYLDSKSGFSTFGIIALIFVVIVLALAFYYGIMCYPFLCRDDKKYRFMDVSSTITAATSRSIQSIENYPVDQKHHHQMNLA